jgi:hypothetical protein
MILLVKLVLAHCLGDFILQPNSWVKAKELKKFSAWQLYVHVTIHALLTLLIVGDVCYWPWVLLILITHLVIDGAKLVLQKKETTRKWFFLDQLLHIVVLITVYYYSTEQETPIDFNWLIQNETIVLFTSIIFLTTPSSFIIKMIISKWSPSVSQDLPEDTSLQSAGMYIGILERLFVFGFIIVGEWETIGFLIAAKSVFRFGDLKEAQDRKLTEYVLIGTLISFGLAIVVAKSYTYLLSVI